jgi:hypothetical protein
LTSQDYNLIQTITGCTIGGTTTHNITGQSPNLTSLANNGGSTQTMALQIGSPAIGEIPHASCPGIDQRGFLRKSPSCDMGAYESSTTADLTKPTCSISVAAGPPATATFTVQDVLAGLERLVITREVNATDLGLDFGIGQTTPGTVNFTKTNQKLVAQVGLQITDLAGNVTTCDPMLANISQGGQGPSVQVVPGLSQSDHILHIANGSPGVTRLIVGVNRRWARVETLTPNQQLTLELAPALQPGNANTVVFIALGRQPGSATLLLGDS